MSVAEGLGDPARARSGVITSATPMASGVAISSAITAASTVPNSSGQTKAADVALAVACPPVAAIAGQALERPGRSPRRPAPAGSAARRPRRAPAKTASPTRVLPGLDSGRAGSSGGAHARRASPWYSRGGPGRCRPSAGFARTGVPGSSCPGARCRRSAARRSRPRSPAPSRQRGRERRRAGLVGGLLLALLAEDVRQYALTRSAVAWSSYAGQARRYEVSTIG